MKEKKFGFTMAEVLIAIAIIGVIAALVLPVMMKNYNNRIFATKARRAYTAVVDACSHGLSDDQVKYPGDIKDSYCEYIPGKNCTGGDGGTVTLKDGTVIKLTGWGSEAGGDLTVEIDTNDTKGPNADGTDKWYTKLTRDCKLADDGSNKTISYLKAHDWKISDDDDSTTSAQEPQSRCSFNSSYSVCKQDDGTSKWCSDWAQTNCKTINGECKQIGGYFSCPNPDGDHQMIYLMSNGSLRSSFPSNCTAVGNSGYLSCPDGDNQDIVDMYYGSRKSTFPSNCTAVSNDYMSCPDGNNQKIYNMSNGNLRSTFPSNCTIVGNSSYMSCPDGEKQKIYDITSDNIKATLPSNCTAVNNSYMSCPDGDNQKLYTFYDGIQRSTLPSNCTVAHVQYGYMSCPDGTQTKVYSMSNGQEQTSYAKAGDCSIDSTGLYVCTNGNKKTYYQSYDSSSGTEVDADCADPFCSNKQ